MRSVARLATAADLDGVLVLYRELRPHDPILPLEDARASFENLLRQDGVAILVCESEKTLTATCMLAVVPSLASGARPFGVIEHVVTHSGFRRRGHARLVL